MEERSHGRGRKKLHLSKIHSMKVSQNDDYSQIGRPGFSRVVYCNEPRSLVAGTGRHETNYVRTTKYTAASFLPKSLFEQFRRVANIYFLVICVLAFTPLAPYSSFSAIIPLIIVIGMTMLKEGIEDWRRGVLDIDMNNRKVRVHRGGGVFEHTEWKNLRVGDLVKVEKDEFFPADLILLSSSHDDTVCYVETMNLDGETKLKMKQALESASPLRQDSDFHDFKAIIKCEDPNPNLHAFIGTMEFEEQHHPLSPQQFLLRDSKLRNTDSIYGAVIFTGRDTKVVQNWTDPPSKRSKLEKKMDRIIYVLFGVLFMISFVGSICFGILTRDDLDGENPKRWYLRPDKVMIFFDPKRAPAAGVYHFLTVVMLYSYLIPISLYMSIEIVKVIQIAFINRDILMYHEEADKTAHARTSNLNEELGQVDMILMDKTGTLTCNSMEFVKCSVAGTAYGSDSCFSFKDERIMDGKWVDEPYSDVVQGFFRLLAICHMARPKVHENTGKVSYEAASPDEVAFVIAAREHGFEFCKRNQASISMTEVDPPSGKRVERSYKLLNVLEFNSSRKRMSVIVRDEEGKLLLLCKGADSVMFERFGEEGREFEEKTREHVNEYATAGLRTLILAYRQLNEEEYEEFNEKFSKAKNSVGPERDTMIEEAVDSIEKDLILLGATGVEDKLQQGVPECIDKLAQAGIRMWILTGDKMETAINIGFACRLLSKGMKNIIINLENPEIKALERAGEKDSIAKVSKESVLRQMNEGITQLNASSSEAFALIIDGKSLTYALEDGMKKLFLEFAVGCASVICCRLSPKQKALVTRLVKIGTGNTTLAIGDGANDVGMLQEADIGIGISGVEGMQAVMSSDIAIAQFRHLERLLLVHGHWSYRRISSMVCYFFYKNITFSFTLFLFEVYASFSAQPAYNDWFLSLFNVLFTSYPVIAVGALEQDLSAQFCHKFPLLYQEGVQNLLFGWRRILGWILNGLCSGTIIFFSVTNSLNPDSFDAAGKTAGIEIIGTTMYTCVIWAVNCQMAVAVTNLTLIHHLLLGGGILLWYVFLFVHGEISISPHRVFVECLAPAPSFWLVTLLVVVATLIPYLVYDAIRMWFFPTYHRKIRRGLGHEKVSPGRSMRSGNDVGLRSRSSARINPIGDEIDGIHEERENFEVQ